MLKITFSLIFLFTLFGLKAQQEQLILNYKSGQTELEQEQISQLNEIFEYLEEDVEQAFKIQIFAHADSDGDESFNQELSRKRGEYVRQYLIKEIEDSLVELKWFGENKPITDNSNQNLKEKNRRVEILISLDESDVEAGKKLVSIQKLYAKTDQELQMFFIKNNRDTVIRCENGTIVQIPAYSFARKGRVYEGRNITLSIKEVLNKSTSILENITTTSDDRMLESGGMVYIRAYGSKISLDLAPQKELKIMIPKRTDREGMSIFSGKREAHNEIVNWTINNNSVLNSFNPYDLHCCAHFLCGGLIDEAPCPFFFCKIKRYFYSTFKEGSSTQNEPKADLDCTELDSLFRLYKVDNLTDLVDAVNAPLYEKYGVDNYQDLQVALEKEKIENIESNYENKSVAFTDLQYYIFNNNKLGWINIDDFTKTDDMDLITMPIALKPKINTDVKLVFKQRNSILPAVKRKGRYEFKGIPKDEEVWLVALKYEDGKPLLAMSEITISSKKQEIEFTEMTLPELKQALKKLDN